MIGEFTIADLRVWLALDALFRELGVHRLLAWLDDRLEAVWQWWVR